MAETVVKHEHIMDLTVDLPIKHGLWIVVVQPEVV